MILFIVFVVQFSVSCACLALNKDQQVCLFCPSWCSFNTFYRSNQVVCFFLYRTSCWRSDGTNPRTLKKTWRKHWTAVASLTSTTTARVPLWVKSTERFFSFFPLLGNNELMICMIISLQVVELSPLLPLPPEVLPWRPLTVMQHVLEHHPAVHGRGAPVRRGDRTLLQLYRGRWMSG